LGADVNDCRELNNGRFDDSMDEIRYGAANGVESSRAKNLRIKMCEFIKSMLHEVAQRKIMRIRQFLSASMTVFAHQRRTAFGTAVRCFLLR